MEDHPMKSGDGNPQNLTLLQILGRALAIFGGFMFCGTSVYYCLGFFAVPATDPRFNQLQTYHGMLTVASFCLLLAGISFRFRQSLLGFGILLLAALAYTAASPGR